MSEKRFKLKHLACNAKQSFFSDKDDMLNTSSLLPFYLRCKPCMKGSVGYLKGTVTAVGNLAVLPVPEAALIYSAENSAAWFLW